MKNEIKTKSLGHNIAKIEDDFILDEKPLSRLIFQAKIHHKGITGDIIRQRRVSKNDTWISDQKVDIWKYKVGELKTVKLSTEAVKKLYQAIQELESILEDKGVEYGKRKYAVVNPSKVIITEENKSKYIKKILESGYGQDIWKDLAEQDPSLVTKLSQIRIQEQRKKIVQTLKSRLEEENSPKFKETSGDNSWQRWVYENNWLFGVNYKKPIEKTKVNISGIMPDFLFPTIDGFVDILEIKLPDDEVITKDKSHSGAWKWTAKTNEAIGQMVNYLGEIDRLRFEIEKIIEEKYKYKISLLKPRAYVLIGDSSSWFKDKKEGLRKMNHSLHGIEILTYRDILDRGNAICS